MPAAILLGFMNLFCAGILAGEEFVICYGVRAPIASLDDIAHIRVRQALIRTLRVLVPAIFGLAILSGIGATIMNGFASGFALRCAGILALLLFIGITLGGTVPINEAALAWNPATPPSNWRALIRRWEQLDTARCWVAVIAFALFLAAAVLR